MPPTKLNKYKYPLTGYPPQEPHSEQSTWVKGANRHMTWWNCRSCKERLMETNAANETSWFQVPPCSCKAPAATFQFKVPAFTEPRMPPPSTIGYEAWKTEQKLYEKYVVVRNELLRAADLQDKVRYDE